MGIRFGRNTIALLAVICIIVGYFIWGKLSQDVIETTNNKLQTGLYKAMVYVDLHGKRTYQSQGRYYYLDINEPSNLSMLNERFSNYIKSHDASVKELKSVSFRITNSESLNGFATVTVKMLPGVVKTVELNDGITLFHFKKAT
ncbi:hypothetical protein [Alicyclobacillus fodiniaquatilis]|uniref:Uncharacterized protein n=1 Tax=Alicyclobacillus fodiniaquatilis TaxID=1661150 RepID=A0ABW4JJ47_9BACL